MQYLIFDIETLPLPDLPAPLEQEVARRTRQESERGLLGPEEAESLVRSTSPFLGQVLAVGMRWYDDQADQYKDKVILEATEEATLKAFFDVINDPRSQDLVFVHYNGLNFDVPFLIIRAAVHGIKIQNRHFLDLRRFRYHPQIDLFQFLSRWGREGVSLELACLSFGIPSPKEGEVKGETVAAAYAAGNLEAVKAYAMRDVEATYRLFLCLRPYLG